MASRGGRSNVIVWRHVHANALIYTAVLLHLVGAASALAPSSRPRPRPRPGGFRLPEGSADGMYLGSVDENGEWQLKYMGKANTTRPKRSTSTSTANPGPGRKLLQYRNEAVCPGEHMDADDAMAAMGDLAGYFSDGNYFTDSVAFTSGSAVAYGCDYTGLGQAATADDIEDDSDEINEACGGWDWSGYYYHEDVFAAYGKAPTNIAICTD